MFLNSYLVTFRDETQQTCKRLVQATSQEGVRSRMQKEKCKVLSIEARPSPFLEALKKGRLEIGDPASKRELATFSNNLALMVATKVNTSSGFQILAESTPRERFRRRRNINFTDELHREAGDGIARADHDRRGPCLLRRRQSFRRR